MLQDLLKGSDNAKEIMAETYRQERLREVEQRRLLNQARRASNHPGLYRVALRWISRALQRQPRPERTATVRSTQERPALDMR